MLDETATDSVLSSFGVNCLSVGNAKEMESNLFFLLQTTMEEISSDCAGKKYDTFDAYGNS